MISLSQVAATGKSYEFLGEGAGDWAGYSVSSAGDVDGDGLDDLLIGAPSADNGLLRVNSGSSYLVNAADLAALDAADGTTDGKIALSRVAATGTSYRFTGESGGDLSGISVTSAGDVDGDGHDDLLIGAHRSDIGLILDFGRSYLVNADDLAALDAADGSTDGEISLSRVAATGTSYEFVGEGVGDLSGFSVTSAGDVDGDGLDDLLIGAYGADVGLSLDTGNSYLINAADLAALDAADGSTNGVISLSRVAATGTSYKFIGESGADLSGISVSSAGDVDGDGKADLLIGANGTNDGGGINSGSSYLVNAADLAALDAADGASNGVIDLSYVAATGTSYEFVGEDGGDQSGISVSSAGDVDGDGHADLLIGAHLSNDGGGTNSGSSYLINADDLAALDAADGTTDGVISLSHVAATGTSYKFVGDDGGDRSGQSVSAAGDVDGDGMADLMIGAHLANDGGTDSGSTYLVRGADLAALDADDGTVDGVIALNKNNDNYSFAFLTDGQVTIADDGGLADRLTVTDSNFDDLTFLRDGDNLVITRAGTPGVLTLQDHFTTTGTIETLITLDGSATLARGYDGTTDDELFVGSSAGESITGGGGADVLLGLVGEDTLNGNAGNDVLRGGTGSDRYEVSFDTSGQDTLSETDGSGTDTLAILDRSSADLHFCREGDSLVIKDVGSSASIVVENQFSGVATDRIELIELSDGTYYLKTDNIGTATNDILVGATSNDVLNGAGGDDVLHGCSGEDTLDGGAGNDHVRGGSGSDRYVFAFDNSGQDTLSEVGGQGTDTLVISDRDADDVSFRRSGTTLVLEEADSSAKVQVENHFSGVAKDRIELIEFTDGTYYLKSDNVGTMTNDIIVGASIAETLNGADGNDLIFGGAGDDTIEGGSGNDVVRGGAGSDRYAFAFDTSGQDTLSETGGDGTDTVAILDRSAASLSICRMGTSLFIEDAKGTAKVVVNDQFSGVTSDRIEFIELASGTYTLASDNNGTSDNDIIIGGGDAEVLNGHVGNDLLYGCRGEDTLDGGAGNDVVRGGAGSDRYIFAFDSSGQDTLSEVGGQGTDALVISDRDADDLNFRRSGTTLVLEETDNTARIQVEDHFSGIATDRIELIELSDGTYYLKNDNVGTITDDIIVGSSIAETLNGIAGRDLIFGGGGDDTIDGGLGNDVIAGGAGQDALTGGAGADIFVFNAVTESTVSETGRDTILDFVSGVDLIDLSDIDAVTGGTNDAFTFTGLGATSGAGTLAYSAAGANTLITGDVDGGGADFAILIAGGATLTSADFIL